MRHYLAFLILFLICLPSHSQGYIGAGHSTNSSVTFDKQSDGLRIDWGTKASSNIDLEWSYIDFGESAFNEPNYISTVESERDDGLDTYENLGFGGLSRSDDHITYNGIESLHAQGLSAGLKFKLNANNWLQLYARASLLIWQATSQTIELSEGREEVYATVDADGVALPSGDTSIITNQNSCGTLKRCVQEGNKFEAVDFWYGYGFIAKPLDWLAVRAEYSTVTLNAINFPKGKLEGVNASLEIHF